ncbi:protein of unknown function [Streptantibioticus cattleyicolor NRRL 8057 = DSM 46488]|nr:protein of unknown function [Streptantibioticus cattleyicolor NRRL 8057 = DSM 46488]
MPRVRAFPWPFVFAVPFALPGRRWGSPARRRPAARGPARGPPYPGGTGPAPSVTPVPGRTCHRCLA